MKINYEEAQKRLDTGEEVWFFINRYSVLTENIHQSVPPMRLGALHCIYYSKLDADIPRTLSPMGARGKPLSKTYVCSEAKSSFGRSNYFDLDFFAGLYTSKESCIDGYNQDLLEKMQKMSAADAKRSAITKRNLLTASRLVIRENH